MSWWSLSWNVIGEYDYASTQVDFSESEARKVLDWGKANIPDSDLSSEEENTGREDHIHCTVLYGLVGQSPEPVRKLLKGTGAITATLGKVSLFENDDFDVVKIDVNSEGLHKLHKLLVDNLENEDSHPEYMPHVTVAYVKLGSGKKYSGSTHFEGTKLIFNSVRFSNSDEEITEISLGSVASLLSWRV